jgi:hypothetical protein
MCGGIKLHEARQCGATSHAICERARREQIGLKDMKSNSHNGIELILYAVVCVMLSAVLSVPVTGPVWTWELLAVHAPSLLFLLCAVGFFLRGLWKIFFQKRAD